MNPDKFAPGMTKAELFDLNQTWVQKLLNCKQSKVAASSAQVTPPV
jgi:hypothetical protein